MAKKYYVIDFSGHGDKTIEGQRNNKAFAKLAPLLKLGNDNVSRFAFFAGLGDKASLTVATSVKGIVDGYAGGNIDNITFIIRGFSAGGITALYFAGLIPDRNIVYIGLADAAFYRGETAYLMLDPGSRAYYLNENYYQTYQNSPSKDEIHDKITAGGWDNIPLALSRPYPWSNYHIDACQEGYKQIFKKMEDIISNDK